jgi:hypothetical protein
MRRIAMDTKKRKRLGKRKRDHREFEDVGTTGGLGNDDLDGGLCRGDERLNVPDLTQKLWQAFKRAFPEKTERKLHNVYIP